MENRNCTFSLKPVHPDQVLKVLYNLKNSKATGMDYLDSYIIKLVAIEILPALTHVINLSITQSVFPNSWKCAKIIPLLKKGDPVKCEDESKVPKVPTLLDPKLLLPQYL